MSWPLQSFGLAASYKPRLSGPVCHMLLNVAMIHLDFLQRLYCSQNTWPGFQSVPRGFQLDQDMDHHGIKAKFMVQVYMCS